MKGVLLTVNYKNSNDTIRFINSIKSVYGFSNIEVIIIDNSGDFNQGEQNNEIKILENYLKNSNCNNVHLLVNEKNLGYFGAVSYAIKVFKMNLSDYDFTIISNNDIIIQDIYFFNKLVLNLNEADVISPSILSLVTGYDQNPYRENEVSLLQKIYFKVYYTHLIMAVFLDFIKSIIRKIKKRTSSVFTGPRFIFSTHGSFVIFSSTFFKNSGYIDDRLFLYGEEEFISATVQLNHMKIKYIPSLQVLHNEHKTTKKNSFRRTYKYQRDAYFLVKENFPFIL